MHLTTTLLAAILVTPPAPVRANEPGGTPSRIIVQLRSDGAASRAAGRTESVFAGHGLPPGRALYPGPGTNAGRARQLFVSRAARAPEGVRVPDLSSTYVIDLGSPSRGELERALAALRADPGVVYAEPDSLLSIAYVPNDPSYSSSGSWGQPYDDLWGLKKLGTTTAWDHARGDGVVVAVIDTGIDYTHPDIDDNIWINTREIPGNGVDDDANGYVDDRRGWDFVGPRSGQPTPDNDPNDLHGHGTHVAGTIAGEGDNRIGVVGVAFRARAMALKGLDDHGSGPLSSLAGAIVYAADHGADVINASWGGEFTSPTLKDAVDYAHALGVVFVAAAGNHGRDVRMFVPANLPNAIAVSALDPFDQRASFSNFGNKIDVAAPGVDILSLQHGTGGYVRFQGTSMAAPHVAGVAALIVQRHPEFTSEQIRQVLRTSATDLGGAGRDTTYGYGRVSAAAAVLVDEVLEAQILAPADRTAINAPVSFHGTARGTGFDHYVLEFGAGANPVAWTTLQQGTTPVTAGDLGTLDPAPLVDGLYTVRLRSVATSGRTFSDQIQIQVRYVALTSPATSPLPSLDHAAKPGMRLAIRGLATGPSFQRYRLEWAPGRDATAGWSTSGITLAADGTSPVTVEGGSLGTWQTSAAFAREYTLRLVVTNAGFESEAKATVYFEPDLVADHWPLFLPDAELWNNPMPVRREDGGTSLVLCGRQTGTGITCRAIAENGFVMFGSVFSGSSYQPGVGDLHSAPGEEVLIPDARGLKVFNANLALLHEMFTPVEGEIFGYDLTSLADLDGDGSLEILAVTRSSFQNATLHVFRASGELYSSRYPLRIVSAETPDREGFLYAVTADLDGNGQKEIVVAVLSRDHTQYSLLAYAADGTPHPAWHSRTFPADGFAPLMAADLDHDGTTEIVIAEMQTSANGNIRVVNGDGNTRPGWPRNVFPGIFTGRVAIGDLDRDGRDEIVASVHPSVLVLRDDGTESARFSWPTFGAPFQPALADVDGDTFPDIVVTYELQGSVGGLPYRDVRLRAITRTGALIKEWPLQGIRGREPLFGMVSVGDFSGDGKTDIAVHQAVLDSANIPSAVVVRVLTTGAPFDPAAADWPFTYRDPRNSRERAGAARATPLVRVAPAADAYVRDGNSAGANFGRATTLEVKTTAAAGKNRITYLRFPLSGVGTTVASAKLRLHGRRSTSSGALDGAYAVTSNTWSETGLTWNNRPALGARQGTSVHVTTAAQYYEWDVTAFVRAQTLAGAGAVSLAVRMESPVDHAPDAFDSREAAANRPELVIDTRPPTLSGHYKILARHSGKAVVVQNASTGNGANVFQWTYVGSARNDEWRFTPTSDGYYKVTARHSGKAMVVQGASTANGGDVIQWSYTSGSPANDEWRVEELGGGFYRIVNRHRGKVLNVAGAGTGNGVEVDQWSWANAPQQQFQIVAVP